MGIADPLADLGSTGTTFSGGVFGERQFLPLSVIRRRS